MSDVLIVKNITREGPGLLEQVLLEHQLTFDLVDLDAGQSFPSPDGYKAVFVLGGPDSANDTTPKMKAELARLSEVFDAAIPYLGICLGLQVGVKAAGGDVVKSPVKEVGFTDPDGQDFTVELTDAGKQDPLFADLSDTFRVFHLHGETVKLTPDMQLLATGRHCKNQIVKIAKQAYGIQSHFELTPQMLRQWANEDPDLAPIGTVLLTAEFEKVKEHYTHTGKLLFTNFLRIAGLVPQIT